MLSVSSSIIQIGHEDDIVKCAFLMQQEIGFEYMKSIILRKARRCHPNAITASDFYRQISFYYFPTLSRKTLKRN